MNEPALNRQAIGQVSKWLAEGAAVEDVREAIVATYPDADADALILAALRRFEAAGSPSIPVVIGFALEATREIYRRSLAAGDNATALRAIAQIAKIIDTDAAAVCAMRADVVRQAAELERFVEAFTSPPTLADESADASEKGQP